jgi:hypothetical protein
MCLWNYVYIDNQSSEFVIDLLFSTTALDTLNIINYTKS